MGIGVLWILGGVESLNFEASAGRPVRSLTRLLPILFIPYLVPNGSPMDDEGDEHDVDDVRAPGAEGGVPAPVVVFDDVDTEDIDAMQLDIMLSWQLFELL